MRPEIGAQLAKGRYELVALIAVGGMGEVWRALDTANDRTVAIKVLRSEYTGDETSLKRLRIEANNASMLLHPNIATVFDYGEEEGTGYLVMEYVDGQSLADVLSTHTTVAPMRLLPILIQAALGLQAAHSAGVVHRDIKPGNILLGPADQVKLTDFGISITPGQAPLTDTGKVMGTAQYLAPEQALGGVATPAGDLYALGIIAYECLVGERPFTGANQVAIALAQVREAPPPLPGSVEQSLSDLIMVLLEKDPADRPADGADLAERLGQVLETHRQLASKLLAARRRPAKPGTSELELSREELFPQSEPVVAMPPSEPSPRLTPPSHELAAPALENNPQALLVGQTRPSAAGTKAATAKTAAPAAKPRRPVRPVAPVKADGRPRPSGLGPARQRLVLALIALALIAIIIVGLVTAYGAPSAESAPPTHITGQADNFKRGIIMLEHTAPNGVWDER
ncbi:MAG: serine/threonine protein kinase [Micrococcales bacterium]|nr:serine/threonine protein kinase [Micrococcales bacterium]